MNKTVLIIDDDKNVRALLRDILAPEGLEVIEADDGTAALNILKDRKIDLLITDRSMPGMGGLELLKEIRSLKNTVPALMISAYGEESFWGEAIGLGALDYLVKPFKADDVIRIVRKSLFGGSKK